MNNKGKTKTDYKYMYNMDGSDITLEKWSQIYKKNVKYNCV